MLMHFDIFAVAGRHPSPSNRSQVRQRREDNSSRSDKKWGKGRNM